MTRHFAGKAPALTPSEIPSQPLPVVASRLLIPHVGLPALALPFYLSPLSNIRNSKFTSSNQLTASLPTFVSHSAESWAAHKAVTQEARHYLRARDALSVSAPQTHAGARLGIETILPFAPATTLRRRLRSLQVCSWHRNYS